MVSRQTQYNSGLGIPTSAILNSSAPSQAVISSRSEHRPIVACPWNDEGQSALLLVNNSGLDDKSMAFINNPGTVKGFIYFAI